MKLREILMGNSPSSALSELRPSGLLEAVLPELVALDIKDAHSHKHKNNFFHSLDVLDNAIELEGTPDLILRTAALLHDIGKPATREFLSGKPTFRNHETVGARQARAILKRNDYTAEESRQITELIAHHMRSFGFQEDLWTDSAVRRLIADISTEEQLKRLFIIFKADVTTRHDSRRRAIWLKADKLWERVLAVKVSDARKALRPALDGNRLMAQFGLKPGRELGQLMRFLNSDEGILLSEAEALQAVEKLLAESA